MMFSGHDGITIAATVAGPEDGPPVLLAHGGGQTKRAWRNATDRLNAGGFRTVAIDLRGHGESGRSANAAYDLTHFARDIVSIVDQLGCRPAFVGA
jgi:pimeloyl-ACP methyl ester carboxylesterase